MKNSGISYSVLRPAVLFGKEDILINNIAWILRKFPVFGVFGDGKYRIQPIYADDFAKLAVVQGEKRENRRFPSPKKIKGYISDKFGWFISLKFPTVDIKKPILVSLIVIPLLFLMNSNLLAMCISSILAGCMAYFVQCKRRNKIVLAATIPVIITISFLILKINYFIFTTQETLIESLSLGLGVVAIYTMALCIFLIPLSLISWYLTRVIRNVKERQDPLLVLEGRCDL